MLMLAAHAADHHRPDEREEVSPSFAQLPHVAALFQEVLSLSAHWGILPRA